MNRTIVYLLLPAAVLLWSVEQAPAQREGGAFFGPFATGSSAGGNFSPAISRPININPATGRTYSRQADYPALKPKPAKKRRAVSRR